MLYANAYLFLTCLKTLHTFIHDYNIYNEAPPH